MTTTIEQATDDFQALTVEAASRSVMPRHCDVCGDLFRSDDHKLIYCERCDPEPADPIATPTYGQVDRWRNALAMMRAKFSAYARVMSDKLTAAEYALVDAKEELKDARTDLAEADMKLKIANDDRAIFLRTLTEIGRTQPAVAEALRVADMAVRTGGR